MKIRESILIFLLVLGSLGATDVGPTKSELEAMYGAAAHEVNAGRYGAALKQLDALEARQPEMAAAKNLRGVALMRLGEYGPAEKALHKARELDPNLWEARFNLAEVPFLQKHWAEARHRFEELAAEKSEKAQGATRDLIQFKILLTWLLQGKEKQAAEILAQLQDSSVSPAYYCGKAAFAFQQKDDTGARVALKAAEKSFSAELNKLFRESFYEIGWLEKPDGSLPVALEVSSLAERTERAQGDFGKAERAYQKGDYAGALQLLDEVDATAPNQAVSYNLRGEVLLAEGKADEAETAFRNALAADPQFADARYNLARVPFKKGDFEESRKQLEALLGTSGGGGKKERRREQLIRYQIFLTLLREGQDAAAQKAMDEFKMMDETPALYYAQAAWAFQHGNSEQGKNWIANANNLYSSELNHSFAAPFADIGWLKGSEAQPTPRPATVAATMPTPDATASPPPIVAENKPAATPSPTATPPAAAKERETPAPVVSRNEKARPEPSPTPEQEVSAAPKKVAEATKKRKPNEDDSERGQPPEKKKKRTALAKAEKKEQTASRKEGKIEIRRAQAVYIPPQTPPRRQNFGDKVTRLLLYPFQHRKETAASTPSAGSVPGPSASPTPTPSSSRPRNN